MFSSIGPCSQVSGSVSLVPAVRCQAVSHWLLQSGVGQYFCLQLFTGIMASTCPKRECFDMYF